jgi:hypothetical protein
MLEDPKSKVGYERERKTKRKRKGTLMVLSELAETSLPFSSIRMELIPSA